MKSAIPQHALPLFTAISDLYGSVGKTTQAESLLQRVQVPGLMTDYGILEDLQADLQSLEAVHLARSFLDFEAYVRKRRSDLAKIHVQGLNRNWLESGGRFLLPPDANLEATLQAKARGFRLVEGGAPVRSEFFGSIDPGLLNADLLPEFAGGHGQVLLVAGLAVATGKGDVSLQKVPSLARLIGIDVKKQAWKELPIDWRRAKTILDDKNAFAPGLAGYKHFSIRYADGDMGKAYRMASALLGADFGRLQWGNVIQLSVSALDSVNARLEAAVRDGSLTGFAGYKAFAGEPVCNGSLIKAYAIASALLGENFAQLKWGRQIPLTLAELDDVKTQLEKAAHDGSLKGFEGYRSFASQEYCDGDLSKAYIMAAALLGENFDKLLWGAQVPLKVSEADAVKARLLEALQNGSLQGFNGYKTFASEKVCSGKMQKAFTIASALLGKDFARLKWGNSVALTINDVDEVSSRLRLALENGSLDGISGYKTFAKEPFCNGSLDKAYRIASALLGDDFPRLHWGKMIPLTLSECHAATSRLNAALRDGSLAGLEGYKAFAAEKYCKDSLEAAYRIASALLGPDLSRLNWGHCIFLTANQLDTVKARLDAALRDGSLDGLAGYKAFAQENFCQGEMAKAFTIASALLGPEFKRLNWGSLIRLNVSEVDAVKTQLEAAVREGSLQGLAGYRSFACAPCCDGNMQRAFAVASAILGNDFQRLNWGPCLQLMADEVDAVKAELELSSRNGSLQGFEGYKTFAGKGICHGSLVRAYHIASALLGENFARLNWGHMVWLHLKDVDRVQNWLNQAMAKISGPDQFVEFLRTFKQQPHAALANARALLGEKANHLNWPNYTDIETFNRYVDWVQPPENFEETDLDFDAVAKETLDDD